MSAKVNIDTKALAKALEEIIKPQLEEIATKVASNAKAIAPVKTGAYKDSIHTRDSQDELTVEVVADVVSPSGFPYSGQVESRHGTMQKAARSAR